MEALARVKIAGAYARLHEFGSKVRELRSRLRAGDRLEAALQNTERTGADSQ